MKNTWKRLLALLLALCLCVSLFPAMAFAEEPEDEPAEAEAPEAQPAELAFVLQPKDGEFPEGESYAFSWELSFEPDRQELLLEETDESGEMCLTLVSELPAEARAWEIDAPGTYRVRAWLGEESALSAAFTVTAAPMDPVGAGALDGPDNGDEGDDSLPETAAPTEETGDPRDDLDPVEEAEQIDSAPDAEISAFSGTCDDGLTWTLDDAGTLTISGTGDMQNYSNYHPIPPWYRYNYTVKKIVVTEGVTSVGDYAFIGCDALKSVQLAESVKRIGSYVFDGCETLTTVNLPYVESIEDSAFAGCQKLATVTLAEHMQLIGYNAFANCTALKTVNMPKTAEEMDGSIFASCAVLEKIAVPSGTESVPFSFCFDCPRLNTVTIPEGTRWIEEYAFCGCTNLKKVTLPQSLEVIGNSSFSGSGLTSVSIPSNVYLIEDLAFKGCKALTSVHFSTGLREMASGVFAESGLKTIVLPENLETLGFEAFLDCTKLTSVSFPASLLEIPDGVCIGCSGLTDVSIAEGPNAIGSGAFEGCVRLKKLRIPASVRSLLGEVFSEDTALAELRFCGDAPSFHFDTFANVATKAYYIKSAAGWTEDVLQNYCGQISWIPTYADGKVIMATDLQLLDEAGESICGKTLDFDLSGTQTELCFFSAILPEEASQSVTWTVSDAKHIYCTWTENEDGSLSLAPSGTGKTGSATVTAKAADGSGKSAKVTVKFVKLAHEISILGEREQAIYGGGKLTLKADVASDKSLTDKKVTWTVSDTAYASINASGVLTTKKVTEPVTVTVTATAAATGASDSVNVTIYPKVTALSFDADAEIVKNTASFDLYSSRVSLTVSAAAAPANACQAVTWTVSDAKGAICTWTVNEDGSLSLAPSGTGKTGSVTVTAKAADGSGKTAKLTVKFCKFAQHLAILEGWPAELRAGAKASFKTDIASDKTLTDKAVTWTVSDTSAASITAAGALTAKKVTAPTTITVTAAVKANPAVTATAELTIYPAVTAAQISYQGEVKTKGQTVDLNLDGETTIQLTGSTLPANAIQRGTWKSSAPKIATVDETGRVTGLKAGTATITFTAADGTKKSTTVKVRVGKWTDSITLGEHAESLVSGKSMTVKATSLTVDGQTPTVKALKWISSDPNVATVSNGKVTAKTVYRRTHVTITASATDGSGVSASFEVEIVPNAAETLLILYRGELESGRTLTLPLSEEEADLDVLLYNTAEDGTAEAAGIWKSSAPKVVAVNENGRLTLLKAGTAKITVKVGTLTATVTVKVVK